MMPRWNAGQRKRGTLSSEPLRVKPPAIRDLISSALSKGQSLAEILNRFEHSVILYALEQCQGDRIKTANLLQIGVQNLKFRMEDSGLDAHWPEKKQ
jgi:DNA-binding NtrC family response regulator